jgi:SAM-dependent methyltransferase
MEPSEYANVARLEEVHWWYTGMRAIATDWLRRLPTPQPARFPLILDGGCGTGGALGWLAEFGAPAGVDIHPLALRLAAERGRARLVQASVEALPFAAGSFHLLTSFDVLYHLQVADDGQALREFARVLRPGGWLLLRVPAHEGLRRAHDRVVHTRHRYTREEVSEGLEAAGFRPVRVTYANGLLVLPALIRRLAERRRPEAAGSDARLPPRPLNALLAALVRAEGWWLRRFDLPVGLSVMALARK